MRISGNQSIISQLFELSHDLQERLRKHNSNHTCFSGGVGDWEIVYVETCPTKIDAYQREREIKTWKDRKKIEQQPFCSQR
jgi:predicted GIY-YIG superfamily endonuclease